MKSITLEHALKLAAQYAKKTGHITKKQRAAIAKLKARK